MRRASDAVALMDSWVGQPAYTENPTHSNCTQVTKDYGPIGPAKCYAWCCATFWDVMRLIGIEVPKSAQVLDMTRRAKRGEKGLRWVRSGEVIEVGDWSCFDWKGHGNPNDMHISMVRNPGTQAQFQTDGGNENDTVFQQWRDREFVMGFIRPPYETQPQPQPEEEPMLYIVTGSGSNYVTDLVSSKITLETEGEIDAMMLAGAKDVRATVPLAIVDRIPLGDA